jgi:hypothetical protein
MIGHAAVVSDTYVRKVLRQEGIALRSQWRAGRRRGVTVLTVLPPTVREPSLLKSEEPRPSLTTNSQRTSSEDDSTIPWEELFRIGSPSRSDYDYLSGPLRPHLLERGQPTESVLTQLDDTAFQLLAYWHPRLARALPTEAPPVFRQLPPDLVGPIVFANYLLETLESETAGAFEHRVVPESEAEVMLVLLSGETASSGTANPFHELRAVHKRVLEMRKLGQPADVALLAAIGPCIRQQALLRLRDGFIKKAAQELRPRFENAMKRLTAQAVLKEIRRDTEVSPRPGPTPHSGIAPGETVPSRADKIAMQLGIPAPRGAECSTGPGLFVEVARMVEAATYRSGVGLQGEIRAAAIRELSSSILEEIERLALEVRSGSAAARGQMMWIAAKSQAIDKFQYWVSQ